MRRLVWIPICVVALLVPVVVLAGSGGGGFNSVVRSLEHRYHAHATRIPLLGLISFVSRAATHQGVANLHVAEFDDFSAPVDGEELNRLVQADLGANWERVIRETSRQGNEQTLIFMHPEGQRMGLFVVDLDGHELDVVQVSVDPDQLNESVGHYEHHHQNSDTDQDVSD
ncbi:MAG: hypothetical protein KGM96_01585 [Acidobacteriota bacterium]|nr:hypothetical protein [Acidobacteriota bacterium]